MSLLFPGWRLDLWPPGRRPGKRKEEGGINTLIPLNTRVMHPDSHLSCRLHLSWEREKRNDTGFCAVWRRRLFNLFPEHNNRPVTVSSVQINQNSTTKLTLADWKAWWCGHPLGRMVAYHTTAMLPVWFCPGTFVACHHPLSLSLCFLSQYCLQAKKGNNSVKSVSKKLWTPFGPTLQGRKYMDTPKSMWPPKNYTHKVTVEPPIPKPRALICCYNSLYTISCYNSMITWL